MPLVYQQDINPSTKLGIWHIIESEQFFLEHVPLQNNITHPHKRLQHLAGRFLLKFLFPRFPLELIEIADTRKPFLPNEAFHFSISHCGDYAAVIVSTHNRVGVDIEIPQDKIARIKHKFLKEEEQLMVGSSQMPALQALTMAWSIKEAIFKWYGNGNVDFREHMHLNSIQPLEDVFIAKAYFKKEQEIELSVTTFIHEELSVAFLLT